MSEPQQASYNELIALERELDTAHRELRNNPLSLDLSRGKPGPQQNELSSALDGILKGDYRSEAGTDTRSYCPPPEGLTEARRLFAAILQMREEECYVGDNSSLRLIYLYILFAWLHGINGATPWSRQPKVRFICPTPGYDRHFRICESLNIEMLPVAMRDSGPDMQQVEEAVRDPATKGIFCVPRFSNPCGTIYSQETVHAIARLGQIAAPDFRIFWDNAYAFHAFEENAPEPPALMDLCREYNTHKHALLFGSTSKITFAGAGICALGAAPENLQEFIRHLSNTCIVSDKVNQLRHTRFLQNVDRLREHMAAHAEIVRPKFQRLLKHLDSELRGWGEWTRPQGGYFLLFRTAPGLARETVRLAEESGLRLTPAGSTWPLGRDPHDRDIRIAPTCIDKIETLDRALHVFVICVKLAATRQILQRNPV